MEQFQIIVLIIAAVILIIIFSSIGIALKYSKDSNIYPPMATTCPEYWTVDPDGNCIIPTKDTVNSGKLYTDTGVIYLTDEPTDTSGKIFTPGYNSETGLINFSDAGWSSSAGKSAVCYKQSWASKNSIEWDGVSNYNACA